MTRMYSFSMWTAFHRRIVGTESMRSVNGSG